MTALKRTIPLFLTAAAAALSGRAQSLDLSKLPAHMEKESMDAISRFAAIPWTVNIVNSQSCAYKKGSKKRNACRIRYS